MGSVLVYLARHAKAIAAWAMIIAAWAIFVAAIQQSGAFQMISSGVSSALSMLGNLSTLIPRSVTSIANAVEYVVNDGDGFGCLMFWLCGFDVVFSMVAFIAAQISGIITFVVALGTASLALFALLWTLRKAQRFAIAIGGSDSNGMQAVK